MIGIETDGDSGLIVVEGLETCIGIWTATFYEGDKEYNDCGRVINPLVVEGQIEGGVAQGIGGAFYERLAYDEEGQLRNASFMEFLMPYATEIPPIEIDHIETPSPLNPLGIKGAGEAGVIPVGAVLASAIEEALGVPITEMPLSPLKLFDLVTSP